MGWIQGTRSRAVWKYGEHTRIEHRDRKARNVKCEYRRWESLKANEKNKLSFVFVYISGVDTRTRTLDNQIHNLALYQLNYIHHTGVLGGIRTLDPRLRRAMLYPTELRAHIKLFLLVCLCPALFKSTNYGAGDGNNAIRHWLRTNLVRFFSLALKLLLAQ